MKIVMSTVAVLMGAAFVASVAMANPALLPKHPGYPASGNANDAGQTNAGGDKSLQDSIANADKHVEQHLMDDNNARIAEKQGAGRLPKVQGPQITIAPPVTSATKVDASLSAR